jgi:CubicO group peptidase (beta-lactamase class C family)
LKKINVIILIFLLATLYIIFIGGRDEAVENKPDTNFIAGDHIYYDVLEILAEQKAEELDKIFSRYHKRGVFNGTVLYGEYGSEIFKGAYGYADFRKKEPHTLDSEFQLASVSKMFTAAAIMLLKEQGKIQYEDTLTKFIPEFPYRGITIRQLLNHRSGLSRYMSLADKYWPVDKPINNEEVIDLFVRYQPRPYFKPDDGFHYCNTNYALLASVVERITGKTFDVFVKEEIFDHLGMTHSFVYNLNGDSIIRYKVPLGVSGHRYRGWRPIKVGDYYLNGVMGDKGVYSTVEDLFKFNIALDRGALISLSSLEEAFKPGSPRYYKRKDNYGFGWRLRDNMDSTAYHFGWWKGFRAYYIRDMKNNRVLLALTNTHKGLSSEVLWDIIKDDNRTEEILSIYRQLD